MKSTPVHMTCTYVYMAYLHMYSFDLASVCKHAESTTYMLRSHCPICVVPHAWYAIISPLRSTWCVPVWCVPVLVNSTILSGTPVEVCLCVLEE